MRVKWRGVAWLLAEREWFLCWLVAGIPNYRKGFDVYDASTGIEEDISKVPLPATTPPSRDLLGGRRGSVGGTQGWQSIGCRQRCSVRQ